MQRLKLFLWGFALNLLVITGVLAYARVESPPPYWLLFWSDVGERTELYRATLDGSTLQRLSEGLAVSVFDPTFSDNRWLYLENYTSTGQADVYRFSLSTRHLQPVTAIQQVTDTLTDLSPDGQWLLLMPSFGRQRDIYRVRTNGSQLENLTQNDTLDFFGRYSPDGQQIAYVALQRRLSHLYIMNPDGSNPLQLAEIPHGDTLVSWSPDGQWLVFSSYRNYNQELFRLSRDGTQWQNLTRHVSDDVFRGWSLDGEWIFFETTRNANLEIYRMRPDGSEPTNLTRSRWNDYFGKLSPDGQWIVYTTDRTGDAEIFKMRIDGSEQHEILRRPASGEWAAAWQQIDDLPWSWSRVLTANFMLIGLAASMWRWRNARF